MTNPGISKRVDRKLRIKHCILSVIFIYITLINLSIAISTPSAGEWWTLGANQQRTSWTTEEVRGQLGVEWYVKINAKLTSNPEVIAANGRLFVSTASGIFAFNSTTGSTLWTFGTQMPVGNVPTYFDGVLYFGSYDKRVYALNAYTGQLKSGWTFIEADAGFEANPLVVDDSYTGNKPVVFIGNRDGYFYALDGSTGTLVWKYKTNGPIRFSAAYKNGVLYFGSDDSYAYALNANTGALVWKSAKLPGVGFNTYWPVIYHDNARNKDYVLFSGSKKEATCCFGNAFYYQENYDIFQDPPFGTLVGSLGNVAGDWVSGTVTIDASKIQNYFMSKPHKRHMFILEASTGNEFTPYAPFNWVSTTHGGDKRPPIIGSDGVIYTHIGYKYGDAPSTEFPEGQYPNMGASGGMSGWKFGTQYISRTYDYVRGFADEPIKFTGGGNLIYWVEGFNMGYGAIEISKPYASNAIYEYAFCGGRWGCLGIPAYGGLDSAITPYKGRLYMMGGPYLVAFSNAGGLKSLPDVGPATPTTPVSTPLSSNLLQQRLESEIQKIISAGPLRPGFMDSGFWGPYTYGQYAPPSTSGDHLSEYFHNPSDTISTLYWAMPYVSASMQTQIKNYIHDYYGPGKIHDVTTIAHIGWKNGAQRETFIDTPELQAVFQRTTDDANSQIASIPRTYSYASDQTRIWNFPQDSFYGAWKYAQLFPSEASTVWNAMKSKFENPPISDSELIQFPYILNQYIIGHKGYVELGKMAGANVATQETSLNRLIELRMNNFNKDYTPEGSYDGCLRYARNFMFLTPELSEIFGTRLLSQVNTALDQYNTNSPYWFVSKYDDTCGEGVFQPIYDYNALFQARARILRQPYNELVKFIDVPAFEKGDLYHIQNIVAILSLTNSTPVEDTIAPVISSGTPTGNIQAATSTMISIITNEPATCKYSTTPNTLYENAQNTFTNTGQTTHTTIIQTNTGQTYTFYARCQDTTGNKNTQDYILSFQITQSSNPDVNNDGKINIQDLQLILQDFGKTTGYNPATDLAPAYGKIDIYDFMYVLMNWGPTDTTLPVVTLTSPASGSTLSGTVTITATASDESGISKVQFHIDGALLAEDATSPYSTTWNTAGATPGSHQITATAIDNAANSKQATIIVNIASANQAPQAYDNSFSTLVNQSTSITLSYTDADGPGPYTFTIIQSPAHGSLSGTGATRTYTPATNYVGADTFTWRVNDGSVNSNTATASLNILQPTSGQDPANTEWFTLGANQARTSWVSNEIRGDLGPVWYRPIEPYINYKTQVIAVDGLLYISTARGMYALNADNGAVAWVYPTNIPLGHSPTYNNGRLYVGSYDRTIHCIVAASGTKCPGWNPHMALAGFETAPLVFGGRVYAGNRDGYFYALDASTGSIAWKFKTDAAIRNSAAKDQTNTIYFASEDLYGYALKDAGSTYQLVWKSQKMLGDTFASYWPVVYKNWVIFSGGMGYFYLPPYGDGIQLPWDEKDDINADLTTNLGTEPGDWATGTKTMDASPILQYYESKPYRRRVFMLNKADGKEYTFDTDNDGKPEYAPFTFSGITQSGSKYPPVIGQDGVIYTDVDLWAPSTAWTPTAGLVGWKVGTKYISRVMDWGVKQQQAADEPAAFSIGGKLAYWSLCCDRESGSFDLTIPFGQSNRWWYYWGYGYRFDLLPNYQPMYYNDDPDGWGQYGATIGVYGKHGNQNPWVPYRGKVYHIMGNSIVAFGPGGSTRTPLPLAKTVAATDTASLPTKDQLKVRLEEEIQKMIDAGHLKPGLFKSSIGDWVLNGNGRSYLDQGIYYFQNPGDTILTLVKALPHLSPTMQTATKTYIQSEMSKFPIDTYAYIGFVEGNSRQAAEIPPDYQSSFSAGKQTNVVNNIPWNFPMMSFYAAWKYAQVWPNESTRLYNNMKGKVTVPCSISNADLIQNPQIINAYLAGYYGYLELEKLAGKSETASVKNEYNRLMTLRLSSFSLDTPVGSISPDYHKNFIFARHFLYLTPETAAQLRASKLSDVTSALNSINNITPYWFVEGYDSTDVEGVFQPPYDATIFAGHAMILQKPYSELVKYLDAPVFLKGDLFYINNLILALEAQ